MRNKIPALSFSHAVLAAIFCSLIAIPAFALGDDKPATPAPTATSATSTAPALTATAAPSAPAFPASAFSLSCRECIHTRSAKAPWAND